MIDANRHLKRPHMLFVIVRHWRHYDLGTWVIISWNQVTLPTFHQQGTALCSKCKAAECLSKGLDKRSETVEVQGLLWCLPWCSLFYSALQLLKFQKNVKNENNPQAGYALGNQPDLKMHFKYSEKTVRHGPAKPYSHARTDISYVGTSYCSVLVYMFLSSQDVLIVYMCFQDNSSALLLRNWCFHCRSYHSFTEPTASLQKEHQICFRTYERCKSIHNTGEYKLHLCFQKFILRKTAYNNEMCTEWRIFLEICHLLDFTVSPVRPIGDSTCVRMLVSPPSPVPQNLLRFIFKVLLNQLPFKLSLVCIWTKFGASPHHMGTGTDAVSKKGCCVNTRWWTKTRNLVILCVMYHHQNPVELTLCFWISTLFVICRYDICEFIWTLPV
jgi:hypothetical protein